jgi:hypothetical protein
MSMSTRGQQEPMTTAELAERGRLMFGERWTTPLARATKVASRSMRNYKSGKRSIPLEVAAKVRAMSALGMPGLVIRRAIERVWPGCPPHRAHSIARQAEDDLTFYKLLRDTAETAPWAGRLSDIGGRRPQR